MMIVGNPMFYFGTVFLPSNMFGNRCAKVELILGVNV